MIRFVVHESPEDGQFYIRQTSGNNEPWFTSEGYTTREGAHRSIEDYLSTMLKCIVLDSPYVTESIEELGGRFDVQIVDE